MLAIRMQRTGRKGHAQFRIIVQDARRSPASGAIVYQLGYYNPHAKTASLDKEKTSFYLEHGAQPSDRVARLLKSEGVKLPSWVKLAADKSKVARHPEKLRKNQPAAPVAAEASEEATTDGSESEQATAEETEAITTESTENAPEAATAVASVETSNPKSDEETATPDQTREVEAESATDETDKPQTTDDEPSQKETKE